MGARKHERLFMAGNQQGKSKSGAAELCYHITGMYPVWWTGYRFERPISAWVSGVTNRKTRDVVQFRLLGRRGRFGTGEIPKAALVEEPVMSRGLSGLVDHVEITHVTGGKSRIAFMSYDMDVDAWASDSIDLIWFDEEPPEPIYNEGLARLTATGGRCYITATPLKGMSSVIRAFYPHPTSPHRGFVRMGLKDAKHIKAKDHERLLAQYPAHERTARTEGIPILGSGLVYSTPEEAIAVEPFKVPSHWPALIGLDLGGGDHPTAWVDLRWDRDGDVIYLTHAYKVKNPQIAVHASAIRLRGQWIPVAWPHDANVQSRGDGRTFANMYRDEGVKMLSTHAVHSDGTNHVEPGIQKIDDRMATGRFKVFSHLTPWFDEFRTYHRKEGKIVKEFDDLMDATRYGVMMVSNARTPSLTVRMPETVGMDWDPLSL